MTVPIYQNFAEFKESNFFIVISKPTGVVENNLMVAVIVCDGSAPIATSSGWTEIQSLDNSAVTISVLRKIAGSSEPSSYTFDFFPTATASYGFIMRITGHDTDTPINISSLGSGTSASPTCPTVPTTKDDCLILRIFGVDDDDITVDGGEPDGTTIITVDSSGAGNPCSGGAAYESQIAAGATGIAEFSLTASEEWVAVTVAIQPAAGEAAVFMGANF